MAANDSFKLAMCQAAVNRGAVISLHSTDPGTTGANELVGGGYLRKTTVWGAPAIQGDGTAKSTGSTQQFDMAASSTAAWYGVWDAAGTSFQYGRQLVPGVTINSAGAGKADVTPIYVFAQT